MIFESSRTVKGKMAYTTATISALFEQLRVSYDDRNESLKVVLLHTGNKENHLTIHIAHGTKNIVSIKEAGRSPSRHCDHLDILCVPLVRGHYFMYNT